MLRSDACQQNWVKTSRFPLFSCVLFDCCYVSNVIFHHLAFPSPFIKLAHRRSIDDTWYIYRRHKASLMTCRLVRRCLGGPCCRQTDRRKDKQTKVAVSFCDVAEIELVVSGIEHGVYNYLTHGFKSIGVSYSKPLVHIYMPEVLPSSQSCC
jgi:hypothetical protein